MAVQTGAKGPFTVKAYPGDFKTLLAFDFADKTKADKLAGFSIECKPPDGPSFYLLNFLQFPDPSKHAQIATEKPGSTANAPIQKFRWVHVPGSSHQGIDPAQGDYVYTVTPRYFDDNGAMRALDSSMSAVVTAPVGPFRKSGMSLGFTRGYMQSQAFAHHFNGSRIIPEKRGLVFDTAAQAGTCNGKAIVYSDIYRWMGSTARKQIFAILGGVVSDHSLTIDVFAYDLDEPEIVAKFLQLAGEGRIRIILDNADLHSKPKNNGDHPMENLFEDAFKKQAKGDAEIVRGSFARFSHDKIFIVKRNGKPIQALTGSTNFAVNGLYVNANHVLVFDDETIAAKYEEVFEQSRTILKSTKSPSKGAAGAFATTALATAAFQAPSPKFSVNFSPHGQDDADRILKGISDRAKAEPAASKGSVIFAVMQLTGSNTPVYETLAEIHSNESVYSYGISDSPKGVFLHKPGSKQGIQVTGKPASVVLPPPFDEVPAPRGHEVHDKFVVCGLNGPDPVVYCGSSNLATGGENANGDNLLEIHDADVATAFAIEALLLVDHYAFLDAFARKGGGKAAPKKPAGKTAATEMAVKKAVKKTAPKKAAAKKAPTKKAAPRKAAAKKTATNKATAKKPAAKKTARAGRKG